MPYPAPAYQTSANLVSIGVTPLMLPLLVNMTQGEGINNVPTWPPTPPKANYQEWQLGFVVRRGLPTLDDATIGAAFVDRFDARYPTVTPTNALLFPADIAFATAIAATTGRTLAQVYRTAAHIYFARYMKDNHHFFVPAL